LTARAMTACLSALPEPFGPSTGTKILAPFFLSPATRTDVFAWRTSFFTRTLLSTYCNTVRIKLR
jgi:hypothetical protein